MYIYIYIYISKAEVIMGAIYNFLLILETLQSKMQD